MAPRFQGLWSIARSDHVHWSREDCDWGGGGQYVGQTGRLAEMLFTLQRPELGWQVVQRMARWVEKFPYFPQTIYGDNLMLQPHERNWFLQVSAGAGAQAVVNGVFGVRPSSNGTVRFQPSFNSTLMRTGATLSNYHFRGEVFALRLRGDEASATFDVTRGGKVALAGVPVGHAAECTSSGACVRVG